MPEQVLKIEPEHELKFKGPFSVPTTSLLKLSNPSEKRVCFKIKTTAPKRYCVRPNAGILEPGSSISIAVVFQPCELEPSANKHKFMVQSLFVPDGGEVNTDALWKDVDSTKLMDTKLRCAFELPMDAASQNDLNVVQEEKLTRSKQDDVAVSKSHKGDGGVDPNSTAFYYAVSSPQASYGTDDNRSTGDSTGVKAQQESLLLKHENTQLREELEKVRKLLQSQSGSGGGSMMQMGTNASPPAVPMLYIVLALVAALVGLVMGKFIL